MIKQAELQQSYNLGRQAALIKLANPNSAQSGLLPTVGIAAGLASIAAGREFNPNTAEGLRRAQADLSYVAKQRMGSHKYIQDGAAKYKGLQSQASRIQAGGGQINLPVYRSRLGNLAKSMRTNKDMHRHYTKSLTGLSGNVAKARSLHSGKGVLNVLRRNSGLLKGTAIGLPLIAGGLYYMYNRNKK
jgi:hypothetical protein